MENADYMNLAIEKGKECGEFIATLKTLHQNDSATITKAAVSFVNSFPLNDSAFEIKLQSAFERAAKLALNGLTEEEVAPLKLSDVA